MTIDDLVWVYLDAFSDEMDRTEAEGDMERAGVTAIVRALRDEIFDARGNASYGSLAIYDLFNEILGSDAGEKVAEGNFTNPSEGRVIAPATDPAYTGGMNDLCVTDAAPAVCEWTGGITAFPMSGCNPSAAYINRNYRDGDMCPLCDKPIKFTEAKE